MNNRTFPAHVLDNLGFTFRGESWGNDNLPFWSQDVDSGFTILVADESEVWIMRHGQMTPLVAVKTIEDLRSLDKLLS